jgi:hypothetical protein
MSYPVRVGERVGGLRKFLAKAGIAEKSKFHGEGWRGNWGFRGEEPIAGIRE